jgi:hypothetical protein
MFKLKMPNLLEEKEVVWKRGISKFPLSHYSQAIIFEQSHKNIFPALLDSLELLFRFISSKFSIYIISRAWG